MNCKTVDKLLSAYFDDELSKTKYQQVSEHISTCEACQKKLLNLEMLSMSIKEIPNVKIPPRYEDVVVTKALSSASSNYFALLQKWFSYPQLKFTLSLASAIALFLFVSVSMITDQNQTIPHKMTANSTSIIQQKSILPKNGSINVNYSLDKNKRFNFPIFRQNAINFQSIINDEFTSKSVPFYVDIGKMFPFDPRYENVRSVSTRTLNLKKRADLLKRKVVCSHCEKRLDNITFLPEKKILTLKNDFSQPKKPVKNVILVNYPN